MSSRRKKVKKTQTNIRTERKDAEDKYQERMNELWKIMHSSTPEEQKEIISHLDEKTIYLLRTQKNIYNKPVYKGNKVERLAFNVVNMKEKYLQRFAMTSLIGFVYRMLDEWSPPGNKDFISQDDTKFATKFNAKSKVLEKTRPIEICESNIEYLNKEIKNLTEAIANAQNAESNFTSSQVLELKKDKKRNYQTLFIWTTKLIKYKLSQITKDKESMKLKVDFAQNDYDRSKQLKTLQDKRLAVLTRKIELRKKYEGSKEQDAYNKSIKNRSPESKPTFQGELDEALLDPEKTKLSLFDKEQSLEDFATMLKNYKANVDNAQKDIETIASKSKNLNDEYEQILIQFNTLNKELSDLKSKYDKHFRSDVNNAVVTVNKRNKVKKKKKSVKPDDDHPLDSVKIKEYELTDEEYDNVVSEVKKELGIETTREEWVEEHQQMVQSFLDEYFLYNPDIHVQCAYKPNYDDDLRTPLNTAWREFHNGKMTEKQYEKELDTHAKQVEKYRVITETEYERSVIPPDDSFFRWQRYIDNNYEELRQATDDVYAEKSDIEWSMVPLKYFSGKDESEVEVESQEWRRKYAEEFEGDVYFATFGVHNMLGSWEQNRESRDFYNKNSEVIKRIIDQNKDDQRMGRRLMKQRTELKKKENIEEAGPDAVGLKSYIDSAGSNLRNIGAKHMSEFDEEDSSVLKEIKGRELERIHRNDESNKEEIEVGFTHIRPRKRHGKFRASHATQGKFHIPAEDHLPETGVVMKPSDMHNRIAADQMKAVVNE